MKRKRPMKALIVDDKVELAETLADGLAEHQIHGIAVANAELALARWESERFDVLVTDLRMPGIDGLELTSRARAISPNKPVIVMTAYGAVDTAIESIRRGAYHYVTKPFKVEELALFIRRAVDEAQVRREASVLKRNFDEQSARANLVGDSAAMRQVFAVLDRVSATDVPVLLTGPTGTGKGVLARTLHNESTRADAPFVTINCAALPETLLESELFGHVKGAFTGATEQKTGLFAEAEDGTLFLDEIGEMAPGLQSKLLDVLERGVVRPVGANKERPVNVRVVTATHRNLRELVSTGKFREDLMYRLDVVRIDVPPLRQRRDDIPLLAKHFLKLSRARHPTSTVQSLSAEALTRLQNYSWPGNVRELAHTIERLVLLGSLDAALREEQPVSQFFGGEIIPIRDLQQKYAAWALVQMNGHRTKTAEKLGVDMKTLAKWLAED